ncbi:hypothetical protein [Pedobacter caeni]|uniref:Lipoprotein n=1 Tax=Pedobacter caeni TaxID=288992 RepID=A0A1M4VGQ1_9SPHI|nr:hypothetical protein [Pedobacter caeni]SHE68118.1 hypothetical protein SAMN04488522_101902 [Pedobacter caeni]
MKTKYFIYSIIIITTFISCESKTDIYQGRYKNQQVTVGIKETRTFVSGTVDYFIKLGDLKPVYIDAHTIDLNGRPYSYAIFKDIPYRLIGPDTVTYKNRIENNDRRVTMLYVDPDQLDLKSYQAYADFFANGWPQVEQEMYKLKNIYFDTHLVGTAYVRREDLVQYFTGQSNGRPYFFDISADGAIAYHEGTPEKNEFNLESSGLAEKIEMPGKIIRIIDTLSCNESILRKFKDRHGKSMEDYFTIRR